MSTFIIDEKEVELKITYAGAKKLNAMFKEQGGSMAVVQHAMQADLDVLPHFIQAATLHTGERFTIAKIEKEIEKMVDSGEADLFDLMRLAKETVVDSFFYQRAVEKMLEMESPEVMKTYEKLFETEE